MYPWRGEYIIGNPDSPVAIVTLASQIDFPKDKVAIWGHMKTENLGIEKVVANVISNPNIRILILCGEEVRGHRSGHSILSLHKDGLDENGRISGAKGAVPFIENIGEDAIERFRGQVTIVDMIDVRDKAEIMKAVEKELAAGHESYGEAFIVDIISDNKSDRPALKRLTGKIGFHKDLLLDPFLEFDEMPKEE
ncbi:MAG: tetrahydromethanopterin S-methyltransferase subunit A [Thermoplasmata archaeon]|nr:tetrahydromethanopterin S-methyltransferase subunit A [Thermoplasmata archaeon]